MAAAPKGPKVAKVALTTRARDKDHTNDEKEPSARWHEWMPVGQDFLMAGMGGKRSLALLLAAEPPSVPEAKEGKQAKHQSPGSLEPNVLRLATIFANAFRQEHEEGQRAQR